MKYIGCYKEMNVKCSISMKDHFEKVPYTNKDKIIKYLKNGEGSVTPTSIPKDFIAGEVISYENVLKSDGVYFWNNTLIYYIEKYNLRLDKEIEDYILNKDSQ